MNNLTRREALTLAGGILLGTVLGVPAVQAQPRFQPRPTDALVVVDMQNCFIPGGSLAVKEGDDIIPLINRIARRFENVVLTQDWHPPQHISFASSHEGREPFDVIQLPYGEQILWPQHCVQGTEGAELHRDLVIPHAQLVIRKGYNREVDSYSAFMEADKRTRTGLDGYLKSRGIQDVYVCGLATDFCVAWTALDARSLGFKAAVIDDAARGINTGGSLAAAWETLLAAGVRRITSADIG